MTGEYGLCAMGQSLKNKPIGLALTKSVRRSFSMLVLACVVSACVDPTNGLDTDQELTSSWVRPTDPQEQIGALEHPKVVARYGGIYENLKAERLVAVVVSRLVEASDDPSRVFKVTLLDTPQVNAFALPGGFLYVTRGLLALANDSSELAAVIAHEMAHVTANHALIRQRRVQSAELGKQVASQVLDGNIAGKFAVAANKSRLTLFSQDQELQADTLGIRLTGNAGFDPFAASRFLETMEAYSRYTNGRDEFASSRSFTSSHPSTPKRIELARRHARFFGAPGTGERGTKRFHEGIDGLLFGESAEEGFVRGNTFSHKALQVAFDAPAGFTIKNQSEAVLVSGPDDLATRFDAAVVSKRTSLSQYLKSGWITGLVHETVREEELNGLDSGTATARGDGWRFRVRVIRNGSQVFRFITAAPVTNTNLDAVSRQITSTFRLLDDEELEALRPLRIRTVEVEPGDTQASLASQMRGVVQARELFRLLNGLQTSELPALGERVKIVTDR